MASKRSIERFLTQQDYFWSDSLRRGDAVYLESGHFGTIQDNNRRRLRKVLINRTVYEIDVNTIMFFVEHRNQPNHAIPVSSKYKDGEHRSGFLLGEKTMEAIK